MTVWPARSMGDHREVCMTNFYMLNCMIKFNALQLIMLNLLMQFKGYCEIQAMGNKGLKLHYVRAILIGHQLGAHI